MNAAHVVCQSVVFTYTNSLPVGVTPFCREQLGFYHSGSVLDNINQCHTEVLHYCKGDAASQWETAILGVSEPAASPAVDS